MTNLLSAQYALIQEARAVLLAYCATLRPLDFGAPVPGFPQPSIRDLLVHGANVYRHWLGRALPGPAPALADPAAVPDVAALRHLFQSVDALVAAYCAHVEQAGGAWDQPQPVAGPAGAAPLSLTPLALLTHVFTHEFHHKGQVLTMSRRLGYTPVDTDVIRT